MCSQHTGRRSTTLSFAWLCNWAAKRKFISACVPCMIRTSCAGSRISKSYENGLKSAVDEEMSRIKIHDEESFDKIKKKAQAAADAAVAQAKRDYTDDYFAEKEKH